jgi:hypothetical protein
MLLLLAVVIAPVHAEIYKYYDSNGNLVLSDTPPKDLPKPAERVDVRPIMTVPALPSTAPKPSASQPASTKEAKRYTVVIQSPAADATFQRNGGETVPIAYSVEPALADGYHAVVTLDGANVEGGDAISAENLERGAHTLMVQVQDESGKVVASASSSFYIQQRSNLLGPTAPKPKPPKK